MAPVPERLEIGRVARPHGLRGEVVVAPITDRDERFAPGAQCWAGDRALVVASARRHQQRWLVRFEGVLDRDGADALRGQVLTAEPLESGDGELWVHELVGSTVVEPDGTELGECVAVEANPAHDLLVLDDGTLVPVVFVVHTEPGRIVVELPEGLLELTRGG